MKLALLSVVFFATATWAASVNLLAARSEEGPWDETGRNIVGGVEADAPAWMVSIRNGEKGDKHRCGGSLIHPHWVLTAAHCVHGFTHHIVWVGGTKQSRPETFTKYDVIGAHVHPGYDENDIINDVALLRLERPAYNTETAKLNRIRGVNEKSGTPLTVMGWGQLSFQDHTVADHLRKVVVPVVGNKLCAQYMGPTVSGPGVICAGPKEGGKDACNGDSGGPLFAGKSTLVGLVSWGNDCGQPWQFGVYTRVSYCVDWIEGVVRKNTPGNEGLIDCI